MADTQETPAVIVPAGSKEFSFNFRTEKIRDDKQVIIGEGKKREAFKAILQVPGKAELIDIIAADGKECAYLQDVVANAIYNAARGQINELIETNADVVLTADKLDLSKLTFSYIANLEPASRAKPEIPEEVYNSFFEDYKTVMLAADMALNRVMAQIALLKSQFKTVRWDKVTLGIMSDRLNLWAATTENMEDNIEVFQLLTDKLDKLLKTDAKNTADSI